VFSLAKALKIKPALLLVYYDGKYYRAAYYQMIDYQALNY
jgi:hypothetical protein